MLVVSTILAGLLSLPVMQLDLWPAFERPVLRVNVPYSDASPSEVERRIVRPMEEELGTVRRLDVIRSTASQGRAQIELEFAPGTDMDLAALEVRERIEVARRSLPPDVTRMTMHRFSSEDQPVLRGAISWRGDSDRLSELIDRRIEPAILQVPGIAEVEFNGIEQREVTVELDQDRMRSAGITIAQVNQALARGNQDLSAGEIELEGTRFLVRAEGQLRDVDEIEALPIGSTGRRLGDIATVRYDFPERDFFYRLDGEPARQFAVFKDSDANVVDVSRAVQQTLFDLQSEPGLDGLGFRFWQDQSVGILEALGALASAGVFGGILAVIILFVFLRRFTPTLIVAAAIPVSLIFTIAILYVAGASLNVITLSGLMLAVGMLIDNAVVVVENIFRHRELGAESDEAAITGASEVGLAIIAGTLTTIIVFMPLFFMTPNIMGAQMREFGLSISFALVASLGVAFTLVPLLAIWLLKGKMPGQGRVVGVLSRSYRGLLDRILDHRLATAGVALLVFGAGGYLIYTLPKDLMPEEDRRMINIGVSVPRDMEIEERDAIFREVEQMLLANREELEIVNISAMSRGNNSQVMLSLKSYADGAAKSAADISMEVQEMLPVVPGVEWRQRRGFGGPGGGGNRVSIRLIGESTDELAFLAEQVQWQLSSAIPGLVNWDNSLQAGNEEVRIRVDRQAAERQGLTSTEVADAVAGALRGSVSSRFRTADREIDILAQLREEDRVSIDGLRNLAVGLPGGGSVPLGTVADIQVTGGPQDIRRENRQTSVQVMAEVAPGTQREQAIGDVQAAMETIQLPAGYRWDLGRGFMEEQQQFGEMVFAAGLALLLIYLLLAALFESLLLPVIIYFSIFFALPGMGLVFLLTGTSISILSFLGILITIGIVVNNSIVMIDLVNQLRARGLDRRRALLDGCQARMRPVLMTSLTTLIGLVPMAFLAGEGMGQMFAPIGQAVIGGLTTSTVLTLTLTPVLYAWIDDVGVWWAAVMARARLLAGDGARVAAADD
jgi:hydrophobic/amphiphilic exporter-1 (mainly G- bacteria), HAE1 family